METLSISRNNRPVSPSVSNEGKILIEHLYVFMYEPSCVYDECVHTYNDIILEMKSIKDLMYMDMGLCLFLTYSSTTLLARRKLIAKTCRTPGKS